MSLINQFLSGLSYYLAFYIDYMGQLWRHITPMQYGMLLIAIAAGGFWLMKSGARK